MKSYEELVYELEQVIEEHETILRMSKQSHVDKLFYNTKMFELKLKIGELDREIGILEWRVKNE